MFTNGSTAHKKGEKKSQDSRDANIGNEPILISKVQNPYYEEETNSNNTDQNFTNSNDDVLNADNVVIIQNPYYE